MAKADGEAHLDSDVDKDKEENDLVDECLTEKKKKGEQALSPDTKEAKDKAFAEAKEQAQILAKAYAEAKEKAESMKAK